MRALKLIFLFRLFYTTYKEYYVNNVFFFCLRKGKGNQRGKERECERGKERERERGKERGCVRERERERGKERVCVRKGGRERERE